MKRPRLKLDPAGESPWEQPCAACSIRSLHADGAAPLFGRSRRFRLWRSARCAIVSLFFAGTLWALDPFFPAGRRRRRASARGNLPPLPPLQPVSRASYVIAPVAVALSAIRRNLDAAAPREFAGKNDNPVSQLLSKADIGITVTRGAMAVSGKPNELTIITPLTGDPENHRPDRQRRPATSPAAIAGLLDCAHRQGRRQASPTRCSTSSAEMRGQVIVHSRPAIDRQLAAAAQTSPPQLALGDSTLVARRFQDQHGERGKAADRPRPSTSRSPRSKARLRNDPFIERTAREQWAKMCRSHPARRRRNRPAGIVAGNAPDARRRRAAADRRAAT